MAAVGGESSSMAKKKFKRSIKRKREEEVDRLDSLPWSTSIPIGEDDDGETFSTLFAGSAELDGGFLSLEEIDAADYNFDLPMPESEKTEKVLKSKKEAREDGDGDEEAVDEIIEGGEEDREGEGEEEEDSKGDEDLESPKIKEKKTKKKKKKKKQKKNVEEAEMDQDTIAG